MKLFQKLVCMALTATATASLSICAFAADYTFDTAADTDYYPSTSYEDTYGTAYHYGSKNLVDYQIPELPYGVLSTTQTGVMEKLRLPGLQQTVGGSASGIYGVDSGVGIPAVTPVIPSYLSEAGIMLGNESGDMMLEQGLTRAQMAALLTRIVTDPEQFETDSAFYRSLCSFTDVPEWAKSYVGYCAANNLVAGYGNGRYGSNDPVTSAAACTVMLRCLNDVDAVWDYQSACRTAVQLGLAAEETVADAEITRGNMAVLICRTMARLGYDVKLSETVQSNLSANGTSDAAAAQETAEPFDAAAAKQDIIDRTNALRCENGVAALTVNEKLMQAAQVRAEEMAASGVYSHTRPDGRKYTTVTDCKYIGENIHLIGEWQIRDSSLPSFAVEAWKNSAAHLKNMLNTRYHEIGVGVSQGTVMGEPYWYCVQLFLLDGYNVTWVDAPAAKG